MSVLVDQNTRLLVQGFTGKEGTFHAQQAIAYGTNVVGGVTPGKGGTTHLDLPVFDTVARGREGHRRERDRDLRAAAVRRRRHHGSRRRRRRAGGLHHRRHSRDRHGEGLGVSARARTTRLIGPNCPGIISPGKCKIGIMPGHIHLQGNVGVVSRSGTLTYEAVGQLTKLGIGQSTCIGIGGDPIIGTNFLDALKLFNEDPDTHAIVMIGEIGGNAEETAAAYIEGEREEAGGRIHRRTDRASRDAAWATPARSSPAAPAKRRTRSRAMEDGGHHGVLHARRNRRKNSERLQE